MQILALEYLRFTDGLEKSRKEQRLLEHLVRGALVASGDYDEKILFPEHFPSESGTPENDADTAFDFGALEFKAPDESELDILAAMLSDNDITINGEELGTPRPETELRPPRDFDPADVEHDSEWV